MTKIGKPKNPMPPSYNKELDKLGNLENYSSKRLAVLAKWTLKVSIFCKQCEVWGYFSPSNHTVCSFADISPEIRVNDIHLPHYRHHKVFSLMKFHQNTQKYIKSEVYENV